MKNKNFILILIGKIISLSGSSIQRFSLALYLLELTGSAATYANILAFSIIPYILFAPIAGSLADNINRKKIMVYLDLFSAILLGGYSIILFSGNDNVYIITAIMFILSICDTLYAPAVNAAIPQILKEDELAAANGAVQQVSGIVNILGPILSGALYAAFGIKVIVIVNSISFFVSAILELFIKLPTIEHKKKVKISFLSSLKEMKGSYLYLKREKKVVLSTIASYGLINIFIVPIFSVFAPFLIKIVLEMSSSIYGIVEGVIAFGLVIGSLCISLCSKSFTMKKIHYTLYPMVLCLVLMALTNISYNNPWLTLIVFALGGMGIMISISLSNIISLTYTQKEIPVQELGKVGAFSNAIATASIPIGQVIFGRFIDSGVELFIILLMTAIANMMVCYFVQWNVRRIK